MGKKYTLVIYINLKKKKKNVEYALALVKWYKSN